jgi:hypothetical protein
VFTSTQELQDAVCAYIAANNADSKLFVWTKSADAMLTRVDRFWQRIPNSDH